MPGPLIDTGFSQAYASGLNSGTDLARLYMAQLQHDTQIGLERRRLDQQDDYHRLLTQDRQDRLDFRRQEHEDALARLLQESQAQDRQRDADAQATEWLTRGGQQTTNPGADWHAPQALPSLRNLLPAEVVANLSPHIQNRYFDALATEDHRNDMIANLQGIAMSPSLRTNQNARRELTNEWLDNLHKLPIDKPLYEFAMGYARQQQELQDKAAAKNDDISQADAFITDLENSGQITKDVGTMMRAHKRGLDVSAMKPPVDKGAMTAEARQLLNDAELHDRIAANAEKEINESSAELRKLRQEAIKAQSDKAQEMLKQAEAKHQQLELQNGTVWTYHTEQAQKLKNEAAHVQFPSQRPGQRPTPSSPMGPPPTDSTNGDQARAQAILDEVRRSNPSASPEELRALVKERFARIR